MNRFIPERIGRIAPYEPMKGDYPVRLDANESFVSLPQSLREELSGIVADFAFNRYPDPLAEEVTALFAAYHGVDPACLTAGNGSDELIALILGNLLERGECVLTASPDFSMYRFYASLSGIRCASLQKDESLCMTAEDLISAARRENARLIIFSNPCNPTAQGMPAKEVLWLCDSFGGLVVVDEAYMDFWDQSVISEAALCENLIVLRTCSKALGMASLRLGFAAACPEITQALRKIKSPYNVNGLTQAVAAAVLRHPEVLREATARVAASCRSLCGSLTALAEKNGGIRVYPTRTNFVTVASTCSGRLYDGLLSRGICVRRIGTLLRITAGSEAENAALISALGELLAQGAIGPTTQGRS